MELLSDEAGIDMVCRNEKWWCHRRFPLVPMWSFTPGDAWNENSWSFTWLFIRYWSLAQFVFRFEIELDERGVGVGVILPYTRLWFWVVPLPFGFFYHLARRPPIDEQHQE